MTSPKCKILFYDQNDESQSASVIRECAKILRDGDLVSFPTETVYGLGALVTLPESVKHIFVAKRRPFTDPIISHFYNMEDSYKMIDEEELEKIRPVFDYLGNRFWPGPLTLVCLASKEVTPLLTANSGYIGLRVPVHPVARELLRELRPYGVGAPSANRFGHVSPTSASHVVDDLGDEERLTVIDVDQSEPHFSCGIGIESTVAKLQYIGDEDLIRITILRRGGVSVEEIRGALAESNLNLNVEMVVANHKIKNDTTQGIDAPGQMITHYAPDVPAYIFQEVQEVQDERDESGETKSSNVVAGTISEAVVIDFGQSVAHLKDRCLKYFDLSSSGLVEEARKTIFQVLRDAEKIKNAKVIVLPNMNAFSGIKEHADACHDRLFRAASGKYCTIRSDQVLLPDSE